jgi:hypothetical protein
MGKASRPAVKTLTIIKSRDIIVDKLLKPCEEDNHSKCTGWAVLKREISPINANYFLKCTCACHKKKATSAVLKKKTQRKKPQVKRKAKKKQKRKKSIKTKRSKRGKRTRR